MPITKEFIEDTLTWQGLPKPGFVIRYISTVNKSGLIELCGAVAYPDVHKKPQSKKVLRRSFFRVNKKDLLKDLTFFQVVKRGKWKTANCATTKMKAPRKGFNYGVGWGGGRDRF